MSHLLKNPDFESPALVPTTLVGASVPGSSAAPDWTTWNNTPGTTTTDILPGTRPGGGKHMIHVCTTAEGNGLVQAFLPQQSGPAHVQSSVWVFVVRGLVGLGTGNGGDTPWHQSVSTKVGKWEQLRAPNQVAPANEFVVYAVSAHGACYYVDTAAVLETPS